MQEQEASPRLTLRYKVLKWIFAQRFYLGGVSFGVFIVSVWYGNQLALTVSVSILFLLYLLTNLMLGMADASAACLFARCTDLVHENQGLHQHVASLSTIAATGNMLLNATATPIRRGACAVLVFRPARFDPFDQELEERMGPDGPMFLHCQPLCSEHVAVVDALRACEECNEGLPVPVGGKPPVVMRHSSL